MSSNDGSVVTCSNYKFVVILYAHNTRAHIHMYIHTHTHAYTRTHTPSTQYKSVGLKTAFIKGTHTHIQGNHTHIHTHTTSHTTSQTHTHTHRTQTHTPHTHTHEHTHAHINLHTREKQNKKPKHKHHSTHKRTYLQQKRPFPSINRGCIVLWLNTHIIFVLVDGLVVGCAGIHLWF